MQIDLSSIIITALTVTATLAGLWVTRQGRKETAIQEQAAAKLADERLELERFRALREEDRVEVDRAHAHREDARRAEDQERARRIEAETSLRVALHQAERAAQRHAQQYAELLLLVQSAISTEASRTETAIAKAEVSPLE